MIPAITSVCVKYTAGKRLRKMPGSQAFAYAFNFFVRYVWFAIATIASQKEEPVKLRTPLAFFFETVF